MPCTSAEARGQGRAQASPVLFHVTRSWIHPRRLREYPTLSNNRIFAADQAHHYSDHLMDCIREPHGNHWRVAGDFLIGD